MMTVFCLELSYGHAQSIWSNIKSTRQLADHYYENGQYTKASELYSHLLESDRAEQIAVLRLGRICYTLKDYKAAVKWLEQYQLETPLPQEDLLVYAQALSAAGQSSRAIEIYENYMEQYGSNDWLTLKVWRLNNLSYLYEDSLSYSIIPLSSNTGFSEFPVTYYNDGLLILSDRKQSLKAKRYAADRTGRSLYALFYTRQLKPVSPTAEVKNDMELSELVRPGGYHIAGISFFPGQNRFIYAKNGKGAAFQQEKPIQLFSKYVSSLNEGMDISGFSSSHSYKNPSLSPDGKTLYFAADLPDGYGGYDLYKSELSGNEWSEPVNLGEHINTPGNEAFPFIHLSGMLYFSSDGLPGFGGYDLFKVDAYDKEGEPQNMGYPLNSHADDFALILNERGERGHFASNRAKGGLDDDVYSVEIDLQQYPLTITGLLKFKNLDSEPMVLPNKAFDVVDNANKQVVYRSMSDPQGGFSIDIPYASQFFIRIQMGDADPMVVSLDIPKNKDKQADHEIVVVSNRYIPIQQTNNR